MAKERDVYKDQKHTQYDHKEKKINKQLKNDQ